MLPCRPANIIWGMKLARASLLLLAVAALPCSLALGSTRVLIGLRDGPLSPEAARSAVVEELSAVAGRIEHEYRFLSAVLAEVPEGVLPQLLRNPHIRYIERDRPVTVPRPLEEEGLRLSFEWLPWGVDRVDAEVVHHPPKGLLALHHTRFDEKPPLLWWERNELAFPHQGGRGQHETMFPPVKRDKALALLLSLLLVGLMGRRACLRRPLLAALTLIILALFLTGCDLINIRVHPSTQGPKGAGARVALLDTGIDSEHLDLEGGYEGGQDFVNNDSDPWDDNGHGTEVAGVLAARENGFGLIGVAPEAELWAVKVLGSDAQGAISDVIKGLEWAIDHGIGVVNMSLGTPQNSQTLREAVRAAWEAGLVLIAAAGNESSRVLYPAAYEEVIAVGATKKDDKLAWFSNSGPGIELVAPGEEVPATYPGNRYRLASGTSFAASHVAGVAALLVSSGIGDNRAIRAQLQETAEELGLLPEEEGFGLVDAERAVLGRSLGDN